MTTATLRRIARAHARSSARSDTLRDERDFAIRAAAAEGMGIREIARETNLDPSLISRLVRR